MQIPDICIKSSPNDILSKKNQKLAPGRQDSTEFSQIQTINQKTIILRSQRMFAKYNRFLQAGRALQARQSSHQVESDPLFRRRYSRYCRGKRQF